MIKYKNRILCLMLPVLFIISACKKETAFYATDCIYNNVIPSYFVDAGDVYISNLESAYITDKSAEHTFELIRDPFYYPLESNNPVTSIFYDNGSIYYMYSTNNEAKIVKLDSSNYSETVIYETEYFKKSKEVFLGLFKTHSQSAQKNFLKKRISDFFLIGSRLFLLRNQSLEMIDLETQKKMEILSEPYSCLSCDGQYIYYVNELYQIIRHELCSGQEHRLAEVKTDYFLLTPEYIFLSNIQDGKKIYRMDKDGNHLKKLCDNASSSFNFSDNTLFYSNADDEEKLYRMDFEGSEMQKLTEKPAYFIYPISGLNTVFFTSDAETGQGKYVDAYSVDKNGGKINLLNLTDSIRKES